MDQSRRPSSSLEFRRLSSSLEFLRVLNKLLRHQKIRFEGLNDNDGKISQISMILVIYHKEVHCSS